MCFAQIAGPGKGNAGSERTWSGGMSMNRFRVWGLSAALAAGVGGLAVAADPNMQPGQTTLVQSMQNLFTPRPPKPLGPSAQTAPVTVTAPLTRAVLTQAIQAETDAYSRRVGVCLELRRVAEEKGDPTLSRQADELERQAGAVYNARVAALGLPKVKAPASESTRLMPLEEPSTPQVAANRLIAPVAPVPAETTAEIHEVKQ
jgi:hypothetical protein